MSNKSRDPRSFCTRCNTYVLGQHEKTCDFRSKCNEELLDSLISAAGQNNEFDNREEVEYYRRQVLERMMHEK